MSVKSIYFPKISDETAIYDLSDNHSLNCILPKAHIASLAVTKLNTTIENQNFSHRSPYGEKSLALILIAVQVGVVAGAALVIYLSLMTGSILGTIVAPIVGMGTLFGLTGYNTYLDFSWDSSQSELGATGSMYGSNYAHPIYINFIGPFIPLVQSLRGAKRYDKPIQKQEKQALSAIDNFQKVAQEHQLNSIDINSLHKINPASKQEINTLKSYYADLIQKANNSPKQTES